MERLWPTAGGAVLRALLVTAGPQGLERRRPAHRVGLASAAVVVRREGDGDAATIAAVTEAAFAGAAQAGQAPVEVALVARLRGGDAWLPPLSLVAVDGAGTVIGHVVCTRAHVGDELALGLGPLSVRPDHQRRGVGSSLMHAVLGAAEALDEPLVVLLGSPRYYTRFGFRPASELGITPPDPEWRGAFQVRVLRRELRGGFAYAPPFMDL
jgi:putative acetyltransferase